MMKILKYSIYIIILILLISGITGSIYFYYQCKQKNKKIIEAETTIKDIDIYISTLEKTIKDFNKKPPVTITKFITLTDKEKEKAYTDLLVTDQKKDKIIDENLKYIVNLNNQLLTMTNMAKKSNHKNDFIPFCLIGVDTRVSIDIYVGAIYLRKVLSTPIVDFKLGGGGAVKFYEKWGGAVLLAGDVSW